jgi:DDE superfamily endonuclease
LASGKKGARRHRAWIVFEDESGFSLTPPVRQTWAPRGCTPVLRHRFNWKRVSAAAAVCYRWDGQRARLYFHTRSGAYNDNALIDFVGELRCHFRGDRVVLLWDGLASHWSRAMRAFLDTQRSWLAVERMPAYAPELNPVEGVWSNLKGGPLANRAEETIEATMRIAEGGIRAVRRDQQLLFGFLAQTGLSL